LNNQPAAFFSNYRMVSVQPAASGWQAARPLLGAQAGKAAVQQATVL
jgi:hypothetical protein